MMKEPKRLWNRWFVQLLLIETFLQLGAFLTRSINANYAIDLGASISIAGFMAGLMATAALVFRPISGAIADRVSKKTLLVFSCALFTVAAFGIAIFQSLWVISLLLCFQGFAFALKSSTVISISSLLVPSKYVGTAVGWIGLAYTVAIACGPAIGSQVGMMFGYGATYLTSGTVLLCGLLLSFSLKVPIQAQRPSVDRESDSAVDEETASEDELLEEAPAISKASIESQGDLVTESTALSSDARSYDVNADSASGNREQKRFSLQSFLYLPIIPYSLVAGALMLAQGIVSSFILLAGEMRSLDSVALYFVFYSLANLGARPLAGRASDAFGVKKVAPPMMVVAMLGMLALAFIDNVVGVAIGGICMGLGQGSAYAAIQAESVRNIPSDKLGRSTSTFFICPDLAMGLGPIAGGAVLGAGGPTAMFVFCALSIALSIVLFFVVAARHRFSG